MQQISATLDHVQNVQRLLARCAADLTNRLIEHDASKFSPDEWQHFLAHTETLAGLTYGSEQYKAALQEMRPAIENHYKLNRHHPEHHLGRIRDMTLIDLLEMLCDWVAAAKRHKDGDIFRSLEVNQERFSYGSELKQIFENTVVAITR